MDIESVTVGLPVGDLDEAVQWYGRVLGVAAPDLEPAEGVVEFQLGPIWLQLGVEPVERTGAQVVVRLGVADAAAEHARLLELGVDADPVEDVPGAVSYFDFRDPYGNVLSCYSPFA
ncbi:VOC family protein [Nocardioides pacificus]